MPTDLFNEIETRRLSFLFFSDLFRKEGESISAKHQLFLDDFFRFYEELQSGLKKKGDHYEGSISPDQFKRAGDMKRRVSKIFKSFEAFGSYLSRKKKESAGICELVRALKSSEKELTISCLASFKATIKVSEDYYRLVQDSFSGLESSRSFLNSILKQKK